MWQPELRPRPELWLEQGLLQRLVRLLVGQLRELLVLPQEQPPPWLRVPRCLELLQEPLEVVVVLPLVAGLQVEQQVGLRQAELLGVLRFLLRLHRLLQVLVPRLVAL